MDATRWQNLDHSPIAEFWDNRIAATSPPLDSKDSRIPEYPDQAAFITKWFEFYHGDPQMPWNRVSPGCLPVRDWRESMAILQIDRPVSAELGFPSLDATLDRLLEEEEQDSEASSNQIAGTGSQAEAAATHTRLPSAHVHPSHTTSHRSHALQEAREQVERISQRRECISRELSEIETELRSSRQHQMEITRNTRTAQQLERVFGTREEIRQQGANYVSPVASLFARAYERHRIAEEVRAEERRADDNSSRHRDLLEQMSHYRRMNRRHALYNLRSQADTQSMSPGETNAGEDAAHNPTPGADESGSSSSLDEDPATLQTLDNDDRPPPMADKDLIVKLNCRICFSQRADTAVLPCGHLTMCSYCAAIAIPSKPNDRTQPLARSPPCPLCRKTVKKIARIYLS
ncbi:MAG: hypothetical protein M1831_007161 [Alyxoria varia]|nr:MAG: hypothetical protein M1831_007161 [Alyxoria varia]